MKLKLDIKSMCIGALLCVIIRYGITGVEYWYNLPDPVITVVNKTIDGNNYIVISIDDEKYIRPTNAKWYYDQWQWRDSNGKLVDGYRMFNIIGEDKAKRAGERAKALIEKIKNKSVEQKGA